MLQELNQIIKGKEEFMSTYTPMRRTVEEFLTGGEINNGMPLEKFESFFYNLMSGRKIFPRHERTISIDLAGPATSRHVTARTEGYLYPYSKEIENSYILLSIQSDLDQNGPLAVLPPLSAFEKNEIQWNKYADIPKRISEILALLPQQ